MTKDLDYIKKFWKKKCKEFTVPGAKALCSSSSCEAWFDRKSQSNNVECKTEF